MAPETESDEIRLARLEERHLAHVASQKREVAALSSRVGAVEDQMTAMTDMVQDISTNVQTLVQARATEIQVDEAVAAAEAKMLRKHGLTPEGKRNWRGELRDWAGLIVAILALTVAYIALDKPESKTPTIQGISK